MAELTSVEVRDAAKRLLKITQGAKQLDDIDFRSVKPDLVLLLRSVAEQELPIVDDIQRSR